MVLDMSTRKQARTQYVAVVSPSPSHHSDGVEADITMPVVLTHTLWIWRTKRPAVTPQDLEGHVLSGPRRAILISCVRDDIPHLALLVTTSRNNML